MDPGYEAIVLAGGPARRMGGRGKPSLPVAGRSMLDRVLAAVADADRRVVVGPRDLAVPPGVWLTRERPAGAGPVAAIAAGLATLAGAEQPPVAEAGGSGPRPGERPARESGSGSGGARQVAVLAADLPLLDRAAVARLRDALDAAGADVALYVDGDGRWQSLCAVWRGESLRARCAALGTAVAGRAVRDLLSGVRVVPVRAPAGAPPPWFDCDTEDDLDRARSWLAAGRGPAG